ncbi:MAG: hypothetical protein ACREFS_01785 [Acetobacteraceae bacterium]
MSLDFVMVAGIVGAVIVVIAYFANQQGWLPSADRRFPAANLLERIALDWNREAIQERVNPLEKTKESVFSQAENALVPHRCCRPAGDETMAHHREPAARPAQRQVTKALSVPFGGGRGLGE